MNKTFSIILLVVAFALPGVAQTPCTRYVAANFSICQPAGWTASADDGTAFKVKVSKILSGTASNGKTANLVFAEVTSPMKLSEFVDATNNSTLARVTELGFTSLNLFSRSPFVTDTNETGIKSIFLEELRGTKLCGVQYIFDTEKQKLLFTFTSFESERAANEKLFDETVKSLKIDH